MDASQLAALQEAHAQQIAQANAQMQQQQQAMAEQQQAMQQAMIAQQQAHVLELHVQQAHAQGLAQGVAQAQQAGAVAAPHPARQSMMRLPLPTKFNGDLGTLDEWLAATQQQFAFHRVTDDEGYIHNAAALLDTVARSWWLSLANRPATWVGMVAALRARFQPLDNAVTARGKLRALKQGTGASSVHLYVSAFRNLLISLPDMGEADRLYQFMVGLHERLASHCRVQNVQTLAEAEELVVRVGAAHTPAHVPAAAAAAAANEPSAMDMNNVEFDDDGDDEAPVTKQQFRALLNAIQQGGNRRAGAGSNNRGAQGARGPHVKQQFTPEQWAARKALMEKGACFNCEETGHRSFACPKPKKN